MSVVKEEPLVTDLVGEKTTKLDSKVWFFGCCDELSCHIMEIRCLIENEDVKDELLKIVEKLSIMMGEIAGGNTKFSENYLIALIDLNKKYEQNNGIVTEFVFPGNNLISSKIHIVRCIARRTELVYAKVYDSYKTSLIIFEYLNKLSTFFYNLALYFEK